MQSTSERIQRALRELDALTKVVFLVTVSLLVFLVEGYAQVACLFILVSVIALLAGLTLHSLKRYAGYFTVLYAVLFAVTFYAERNARSAASVSGVVFLKWVIVLIVTLTVVFTTNPQDLIARLVSLRFPRSLAFVIGLTLRFFPFIRNEIRRVAMAQQARGCDLRISTLRLYRLPFVMARIFMPLMISLLKFSDEVTVSMASRGITIERYTQRKLRRLDRLDIVILVANLLALGAVLFL